MRILPPRAPSLPIPRNVGSSPLGDLAVNSLRDHRPHYKCDDKQDACYKAGAKGRPAEGEIGKRRADQHRCNLDWAGDISEESEECLPTRDPESSGPAHS